MDTTKWAPIPGFDGAYEIRLIDKDVQVRSYRSKRGYRLKAPNILLGYKNSDGRRMFLLTMDSGEKRLQQAAYWALYTFDSIPVATQQALHRNDIHSDNRLSNLYWGTSADNARDRTKNGRGPSSSPPRNFGTNNGSSRLNWDLVHLIRTTPDVPATLWAKRLGVSPRTIMLARNHITWKQENCPTNEPTI